MAKYFSVAVLVLLLFAGTSFSEIIIYSVIVDQDTNNFDVYIQDVAPQAGSDSNGGIAGFSIRFTPNVDYLEIARLQGNTGSITGFDDPDPADMSNIFGIGTDNPNLFGAQFGSGAVFGFGQEAGVIPNLDIADMRDSPTFFDGDIAFDSPAYVGRGHFTGDIQDFGLVSTNANVYAAAGDPSTIVILPADEVIGQVEVIPEPASLAILLGSGWLFLARRRLT
jgi:hypothetical protein